MSQSDTPVDGQGEAESKDSRLEYAERLRVTEYFRARLAEEVRRAERYGRRLSVVFVHCREASARSVFSKIRPRLRCTDIVEVIQSQLPPGAEDEPEAEGHDEVAMILPETSRAGAQRTLARIKQNLGSLPGLRFGIAYYPDDSAKPHELLLLARKKAGEGSEI